MAKSLEEALKNAGVTKDTVRKATDNKPVAPKPAQVVRGAGTKEGDTEEPSFSDLMSEGGVVRAKPVQKVLLEPPPADRRRRAPVAPEHSQWANGSKNPVHPSIKTTAPTRHMSNELADLNNYMALLVNTYHQKQSIAPVFFTPQDDRPLLEIIGPLVPNPLLETDDVLDAAPLRPKHDGIARHLGELRDDHGDIDMTIGLDFGTSSVKVVVRDSARRAFAIPFFMDAISNLYLMPSRLYEFNGLYQLDGGGLAHRNMKLRLVDGVPSDEDCQRAAAFLALVIRHCRGWLLSEKADVYRHARLEWFLNLGLPAASYQNHNLVTRFRTLALAAMNLANSAAKRITVESTKAYWEWASKAVREEAEIREDVIPTVAVDMIAVVPEISAQVYGYVNSSHFDEHAANNYMLVDIGAGTVDASIFHVRKEAGGAIGFTLYANNVAQNGVMNLHRERLDWLRKTFAALAVPSPSTIRALEEMQRPTDRLGPIPNGLTDYFEGIRFNFSQENKNPDSEFFRLRYWRQVFGDTLFVVRGQKLRDDELSGLRTFITGGGARMEFFSRIVSEINSAKNVSWARLRPSPLEPPRELIAPGLKDAEYDRLSVAFGLSFIRLGTYIKSVEVPNFLPPPTPDYYNNFISKDQV